MFISIPKDFFVPVLFSEDFRYNFENDAMEYESDSKESSNSFNRQKLQDLDYIDDTRQDSEFTAEYMENMININDKRIEEQISNYAKNFMKFIEELKRVNCLGTDEADSTRLINYYAKSFRDLYNEYKSLIKTVKAPIYPADAEGIINEYIGRIKDIFNKNIEELNCKNLNYDVIEVVIEEIVDGARAILREGINNINCEFINRKISCISKEELNNSVKRQGKIYNIIDEEFVREMVK